MQLQSACPIVVVPRARLAVADAGAELERLQKEGVTIAYPLRDEPWGQRRFGLLDPAGMGVDVVEQVDPAPGYREAHA